MTATPVYWEPWAPAVGDRVRVRLSAECRLTSWLHEPELDALAGYVETVWPESVGLPGHRFYVRFHPPIYNHRGWEPGGSPELHGTTFAAIELEPILTDSE